MSRLVIALLTVCCLPPSARAADVHISFSNTLDRIWAGPELWANPMEDWRVHDGKLECISGGANRNVQILTAELSDKMGDFTTSVRFGMLADGKGSAGFRIGIQDEIDDYRARLIYGSGVNAGLRRDGTLFIGDTTLRLLNLPDLQKGSVLLTLRAVPKGDAYLLQLAVSDGKAGIFKPVEAEVPAHALRGNIALVNNHFGPPGGKKGKDAPGGARYWFDDWKIAGSKLVHHPKRTFGPVLFSTYTLSRGTLKMLAHMPPIGDKESQTVRLRVKGNDGWKVVSEEKIEPHSRTAQFKVADWNDREDIPYSLAYTMIGRDGKTEERTYEGTVRKDPAHHKKELVMAAFTGNADYGFPNLQIVRNLEHQDPDLLFFSGDQIYEYVGGYPLIRTPPDRAILNYLRKWYLVGLAFGDLCRDRPSIFIPDDHDVYQGNIWGNGGNPVTLANHARGGYVPHPDFVNVVHRTQCGNLPDPFDPTPIKQNISVYYTDLVYGKVGFAVIADRMFKSGPEATVSIWKGRPDHLKDPKFDVEKLDKPGLELLGDRQEKFLDQWGRDWKGVNMKCVLSQTIFCNLANYHGPMQEYLVADLDSGGWPQSGRDRALDLMRRSFALHVAGDQHLASIVQHGIDAPADAAWSFCVPSIANFYPRSWKPDKEGLPVKNRPEPGLPNTGDYVDGLGNHIRVLAVGNPEPVYRKGRLASLHDKASGYGLVRFHTRDRTMTMECYKLLVDVSKPARDNQFPGWPRTIHMLENYERKATGDLPLINVRGMEDAVVQVVDEKTKTVAYTLRIQGTSFRPMVFSPGPFTVHVGELGTDRLRTIRGIRPVGKKKKATLEVEFSK